MRPATFTPAKAPSGWKTLELFDHHLTISTPGGWRHLGGGTKSTAATLVNRDQSVKVSVLYQTTYPAGVVLDPSGAKRVFFGWPDINVSKTVLRGAQIAYYGVGDGTNDASGKGPKQHGAGLVFQIKDGPRPIFGWVVVIQSGPASSEELTAIIDSVALK